MIVYWMLSSNCDTEAVKYWTCDDFSCKGKNRRIISLLHYICRYWQRTWNVCKKIHQKEFHHQLTIQYLRIIYENMIKLYRYIYYKINVYYLLSPITSQQMILIWKLNCHLKLNFCWLKIWLLKIGLWLLDDMISKST